LYATHGQKPKGDLRESEVEEGVLCAMASAGEEGNQDSDAPAKSCADHKVQAKKLEE
jgi:hypothetical protein